MKSGLRCLGFCVRAKKSESIPVLKCLVPGIRGRVLQKSTENICLLRVNYLLKNCLFDLSYSEHTVCSVITLQGALLWITFDLGKYEVGKVEIQISSSGTFPLSL